MRGSGRGTRAGKREWTESRGSARDTHRHRSPCEEERARDFYFAGTGVASWSTPDLMRGLCQSGKRPRMSVGAGTIERTLFSHPGRRHGLLRAERAAQRLGSVLSREEASADPNSWAFSYHVRAKSTLAN
jgi:hypothetical protein